MGMECISIKTKVLDSGNHTIGIGGIACYLHQMKLQDIISIVNKLTVFKQPINDQLKYNYIFNGSQLDKLTVREKQCVYYLSRGMGYKEIGKVLNISPRTVETHIIHIKEKLRCYSRSDIIAKVFEDTASVG